MRAAPGGAALLAAVAIFFLLRDSPQEVGLPPILDGLPGGKAAAAGSAAKQRWENAGAPSPPSRAAVCVGSARNPHAPRCGSVCLRLCVCGSADAPPWDETVAEPRRVSWSHDRDSSDSRPRPALPAPASRC